MHNDGVTECYRVFGFGVRNGRREAESILAVCLTCGRTTPMADMRDVRNDLDGLEDGANLATA